MIETILKTAPPGIRRNAEPSSAPGIDTALARLSPDDSALLELSLRRRISDDEIAELLGVGVDDIERRRDEALDRLVEHLHLDSTHELVDLLARGWNGHARPSSLNGAPATNGASATPAVLKPVPASHRGRLLLLGAILAVAAVGAITLAFSSGGNQGSTSLVAPARPAPKSPFGPSAALVPLGAARGAWGTVRTRGSRLMVWVQGLPSANADYQVWLYDSVARATPIGRLRAGRLDARLPAGFARYRYVDVSREPRDGNANHSGASVLRVPVSALKR